MKRLFKLIVLTVLVAMVAVPMGGLLAQDGEIPIKQGVVNTQEGIGIYSEADINSEILGSYEPGEVVMVLEESGLWARTSLGWVLASGLNLDPAAVDWQGVAIAEVLAIRAMPNIRADVVKTVGEGTVLGVHSIFEEYARVYDGRDIGWAFVADLDLSVQGAGLDQVTKRNATVVSEVAALRAGQDIQLEAVATLENGATAQVLAVDDLYAYVVADDGSEGWGFAADFDIDAPAYGLGELNAGPVNFRDAPAGVTFYVLPFQAPLVILGQDASGEWLNVRYNAPIFVEGEEVFGAEGWVSADFVNVAYGQGFPVTGEVESEEAELGTIVDVAVADGRFTTLVTAVEAAGLVDTLSGEGPFTVFAPVDDAFAGLPEGTLDAVLADNELLTSILLYHVVPGEVFAADVVGLESATTVEGSDISITVDDDGNVFLNDDIQVIITDVPASNGVIHVIDGVLVP
jgi:uncharacterized surface protein with fasciclin (FAS1) repeats